MVRESQARPLILVVEDLHWSDAGTQAVLDHLVDRVVGSRVLLLLTHRPEYRHDGRGQHFQLSEILRLKGDLLAMLSKSRLDEAEACFREAIDVAERQGAKLPKLQATMSFARLLVGKGEAAQARALLQPAYDAITEGRDLTDLKAAAALLAELRAQ